MLRDKLVRFCQDYLRTEEFQDNCVNGLQVEGKAKVSSIVLGVSLSKSLIETSMAKNADMIIVHHGIFSGEVSEPPCIKGVLRLRLSMLLKNDINLCGFHLPLDAHPKIGNNIILCKQLRLTKLSVFGYGYIGEYASPMLRNEFISRVSNILGSSPSVIAAGPTRVKRVAVVSGGASRSIGAAIERGVDTFLTGDIQEYTVRAVEEAQINYVSGGHYNTEKGGIQKLGGLIGARFGLKTIFVDIPCQI